MGLHSRRNPFTRGRHALDHELAQQDGFDFRATHVQPASGEPDWPTIVVSGPSEAHRSTLTITFDSPDESDRS